MLYVLVGDQIRAPGAREEQTTCRGCDGLLASFMSVERGTGRGGWRRGEDRRFLRKALSTPPRPAMKLLAKRVLDGLWLLGFRRLLPGGPAEERRECGLPGIAVQCVSLLLELDPVEQAWIQPDMASAATMRAVSSA